MNNRQQVDPRMVEDPIAYAVAELQGVQAALEEMGLRHLALRTHNVKEIFLTLMREAEAENDRLEREKLEAEERKRQSKKKAAETRKKTARWDQKCKTNALAVTAEEREELILDWLIPTLNGTPRVIPVIRDDEGSIWAELTPNVPSDIITTREDMGTVMQIAEMHGLMKRELTKKQYVEDVDAVRALMEKYDET